MQYKRRVLARFPTAKAAVTARYPDMEPRWISVFNDGLKLDVGDDGGEQSGWGGSQQLATAAWRSAYAWCVRNPVAKKPVSADG